MSHRFDSDDDGLSLVELLVTIVIFAMIGIVVATAMITTLQTSRNVAVRGDDLNAVQVASEEMSKLLRTAAVPPGLATTTSAISAAAASDLTFYAYTGQASHRRGFASGWTARRS